MTAKKRPPAAVRDGYAAWVAALADLSPQRTDVVDKFAAADREYARRIHLIEMVEAEGLGGTQWDPRSEVTE